VCRRRAKYHGENIGGEDVDQQLQRCRCGSAPTGQGRGLQTHCVASEDLGVAIERQRVARRSLTPALIGRVEDWRAGLGRCRATSPVPSTSNAECGFPALRSPICFMPRLMGTYPLQWPDGTYSVQGAAAALSISTQTVFKWLQKGR
jgi:hypothetical protein